MRELEEAAEERHTQQGRTITLLQNTVTTEHERHVTQLREMQVGVCLRLYVVCVCVYVCVCVCVFVLKNRKN